MKKQTFLISAVAWLMAMPVMAEVGEKFTSGILKFKVITETEEKKEVQVIRPGAALSGHVEIPPSIRYNNVDYTVVSIKGGEIGNSCAFREMTGITSVTIPETVRTLDGVSIFYGCTGLKQVFNNGRMDMIEGWTFCGCTNLKYCKIPTTVKTIGQSSFQDCTSLTTITIPASVNLFGQSAFEGCSALKDLTILGSVELNQYALKGCSALKSIYYCGSTLSLKPTENTYKIFENTNDPVIYTKTSALSTIQAALNGKADWIKDLATDEIPYTPAKEYTTFCRDFDVDFSAATGLKAGVALSSTLNEGKLTFTVKNSVPAGTGVLLKKLDSGEFKLKIAESAPAAIDGNKLIGVVAPTTISQIDGSNTNFVLSGGVFKKIKADGGNTIPAGKAYLQLPTSSGSGAPNFTFSFEDDITGINMIQGDELKMNGYYNLAGQHVANPTKGLYIINGKKVVVK